MDRVNVIIIDVRTVLSSESASQRREVPMSKASKMFEPSALVVGLDVSKTIRSPFDGFASFHDTSSVLKTNKDIGPKVRLILVGNQVDESEISRIEGLVSGRSIKVESGITPAGVSRR